MKVLMPGSVATTLAWLSLIGGAFNATPTIRNHRPFSHVNLQSLSVRISSDARRLFSNVWYTPFGVIAFLGIYIVCFGLFADRNLQSLYTLVFLKSFFAFVTALQASRIAIDLIWYGTSWHQSGSSLINWVFIAFQFAFVLGCFRNVIALLYAFREPANHFFSMTRCLVLG